MVATQLKLPIEQPAKRLPRILTKEFLRRIFSIDENGLPCSSYLMKKQFDVLFITSMEGLNMTLEQFRILKVFNIRQTQKIYSNFQITKDDVSDL